MSRRANAGVRCAGCLMQRSLCICALVPRIETRARLTLLIHFAEARKPTNTGRLAADCLVNSEILTRGREGEPEPSGFLREDAEPLLLFPFDDARPLSDYAGRERPVQLIVPDGTWRQAYKTRKRVPGLAMLPCVTLPEGPPTRYRLRAETHVSGLATMEAIARAMGILEGDVVREAMEEVFLAMVERTLWLRGALEASEVRGGVPEAAIYESERKRAPVA